MNTKRTALMIAVAVLGCFAFATAQTPKTTKPKMKATGKMAPKTKMTKPKMKAMGKMAPKTKMTKPKMKATGKMAPKGK